MKRLVIGLLIPSMVWAQCPNAISLTPGQPNDSCQRIGLSVPYAESLRASAEKSAIQQQIIDEQTKLIDAKSLSLTAAQAGEAAEKADNQELQRAYEAEQSRGKVDFWLGVGAGFLAVLFGAIAIKQVR